MTFATYFTLLRVLISPLFFVIYVWHDYLGISEMAVPYVLLVIVLISECSDALDGYLARKYDEVTDFGKILDPMADSISRISIFLTFTQPPVNLPILLLFIFIYRDSIISTLRTICALKGFALAARASGKIKAAFQAFAVFFTLIFMILYTRKDISAETFQFFTTLVVGLAAAYTIFSGIDYIYANRHYIKKFFVKA